MKIGILTFHRPSNFGANLQAYSSVCYFTSKGHEVKVIDYVRPGDFEYKDRVVKTQFYAHMKFVEENLPLTERVTSIEGLAKVVNREKFDAILVGADAVWRSPKDECVYFAKWLFEKPEFSDVKVASISPAHMGNGFSSLDEDVKCDIKECLSKFKYITVRDEWTKYVINRDIFKGQNIVNVINPDPVTTLHNYIDNREWVSDGFASESYIVMTLPADWCQKTRFGEKRQQWFNEFKKIAHKSNLKIVELPLPEGKSGMEFDHVIDYPIDPLQWFLWIKNAKAFCGMRFHAIVSSISSGTPFYSIDYYGVSSKKTILLDYLGLHKLARKGDVISKIRNLLLGSGFENNRTGRYLEFESPEKVFTLLNKTSRESVITYREKLELIFDRNMEALQKAISNE